MTKYSNLRFFSFLDKDTQAGGEVNPLETLSDGTLCVDITNTKDDGNMHIFDTSFGYYLGGKLKELETYSGNESAPIKDVFLKYFNSTQKYALNYSDFVPSTMTPMFEYESNISISMFLDNAPLAFMTSQIHAYQPELYKFKHQYIGSLRDISYTLLDPQHGDCSLGITSSINTKPNAIFINTAMFNLLKTEGRTLHIHPTSNN